MKIVVYVKPKKKNQLVQFIGKNMYDIDEYDVDLTNLPIDGKCNDELIDVLSKNFKICKSDVKIVSGFKSRCKVIDLNIKL